MGKPPRRWVEGWYYIQEMGFQIGDTRKKNLRDLIPNCEQSGIDLLELMLKYTPSDRITPKEILQH